MEEVTNTFGNTINTSASINSKANLRRTYELYLAQRIEDCVTIDAIELSKRAIDAGANAQTAIKKATDKLREELQTYVKQHADIMFNDKTELLHITELESKSETPGYRNGNIIDEIQRVVVFKKA